MAFTENVTIDEGVVNGIRTKMHFEHDGGIVVQKTFDAEPHLTYAADARRDTAGMNWGEGRMVGHIPDLYLAPILAIKGKAEREKAVKLFFQQNPAFVMFDKFLK